MNKVRCAIYTRKSSEEGLEQDFNSLDAQYAACAAYIASQTSEGWSMIDRRHDDGGVSGGTLERPALQRLLGDIGERRVDIVVVYKVDRLSRSLLDFAKLVETFDKAGISFVSVTQSFNTTTSMGRLTLNMLLSFAQFEREVTAERIRDKLAASKARGMWMGGAPPLGYRPDGHSLAIVDSDAELVQTIFKLYLERGNVRQLQDELVRRGIIKPRRTTTGGKNFGGTPFARGEIYSLLANPIYIGRIRHRDKTHAGLHPRIIDDETWEAVQSRLADNRKVGHRVRAAAHPSMLAGKLFDDAGQRMIPSHASKGQRRYRYYVSQGLNLGGTTASAAGMRIPAQEIEALVSSRMAVLFDDPIALIEKASFEPFSADRMATFISRVRSTATTLTGDDTAARANLIAAIVQRIDVGPRHVTITVDAKALTSQLGIDLNEPSMPLQIVVPVQLKRSGFAMRLVLESGQPALPRVDDSLVEAIATAHRWWQRLVDDPMLRVTDLAEAEPVSESWITRILRLAFVDPKITEGILAGKFTVQLTSHALRHERSIPALWADQRTLHRIPASI